MNDSEREHLLNRISDLERANRRWKVLALAGTPFLALLLVLVAANGFSYYLMFRDARQREQQARLEAEEALNQAQNALSQAEVARLEAIRAEAAARVEVKDAARTPHEPEP
jgi:hypothetical protein